MINGWGDETRRPNQTNEINNRSDAFNEKQSFISVILNQFMSFLFPFWSLNTERCTASVSLDTKLMHRCSVPSAHINSTLCVFRLPCFYNSVKSYNALFTLLFWNQLERTSEQHVVYSCTAVRRTNSSGSKVIVQSLAHVCRLEILQNASKRKVV